MSSMPGESRLQESEIRGDFSPTVRVAQLMPSDLRPYRRGFYEALARRREVEVTIYAGQAAAAFGAPKDSTVVPQRIVPLRNHYWPGTQKTLWQSGISHLLRSRPDVVVLPEVVHSLSVLMMRLVGRLFGARLVVHGFFYRSESDSLTARVRDRLRWWLHAGADSLVAYTERGSEQLRSEGVSSSDVFVSRNTLDTSALSGLAAQITDEAREAMRSSLGIQHSALVLVWLGRLLPEKMPDVAVSALESLASSGRDVHLMVIGDGPLREELDTRAEDLPVSMVGAVYDEAELAEYLSIGHVLVVPGRIGLSCVHGFANGLPAVTSNHSAVDQSPEYDYIVDGVNGLLSPSPSPEDLAATLGSIWDEPGLLTELSAGARRAAAELQVDGMVEGFVDAIMHAIRRDR